MSENLTIALAQLNPTVGAIDNNMAKLQAAYDKASSEGCDVMVTSELLVTGYPPEDLVLKPVFMDHVEEAVLAFIEKVGQTAALVGTPWRIGDKLYNCALFIQDGEIKQVITKHHRPNYGVFDEVRIFEQGDPDEPIEVKGYKLGVLICEDMWFEDVAARQAQSDADLMVVLNGSPYESDKPGLRVSLAKRRVMETGKPLIYVNQIGGQDELVFDGASFAVNKDVMLAARLKQWQEDYAVITFEGEKIINQALAPHDDEQEALYEAMCLGLRDYVLKNGFPGVVLGLSGGVDSALSAAVAVDALGPDKVHCVMMPSPYTSEESLRDAKACADFLGVSYDILSIDEIMTAYDGVLAGLFQGKDRDITEENIQSRARALMLMAISNKFGHMLLTTGNKSEMSVGYATIYGDMCGGYSVLKDIYKMAVFELSSWRNGHKPAHLLGPDGPVMPENVITKAPTAELRADQKDEDSLPPYKILDQILECLIEKEYSLQDIVALGHEAELVRRIWRLVDRAEYKRRQAPPGVKVTSRAFGRDRRYPLTNGFTSLI